MSSFEEVGLEKLVPCIGLILQRFANDNSWSFYPISNYYNLFVKHSLCSLECFIISIILIDKYIFYKNKIKKFKLTASNIRDIFIGSIVIAIKIQDDYFYNNNFYGSIIKVSGMFIAEKE